MSTKPEESIPSPPMNGTLIPLSRACLIKIPPSEYRPPKYTKSGDAVKTWLMTPLKSFSPIVTEPSPTISAPKSFASLVNVSAYTYTICCFVINNKNFLCT